MNFIQDFNVHNFSFRSGAKDCVEDLDYSEMSALGQFIEDWFDGVTPTATQINDFVLFECDGFIYQLTHKEY